MFLLLNGQTFIALQGALFYMKVAELKQCCKILGVSHVGKKHAIINRILKYIKTGLIEGARDIPDKSKAPKNYVDELKPFSLMLYGSYKNDLKHRQFFKSLIGPMFHFTAFGIDWLEERWKRGYPPTYQEFADYWIAETKRRSIKKVSPKKEWAYINFMQKMAKERPDFSKQELVDNWKMLRAEKVAMAMEIINKIIKKTTS